MASDQPPADGRILGDQTDGNFDWECVMHMSEVVPPSLVEIAPILRVADEVEPNNPRVAYFCRFYAFERTHKLDPTSSGLGVRQFKTALLRRLKREEHTTALAGEGKNEALEMLSFYQQYYEKHFEVLQNADDIACAHLKNLLQTASVFCISFEVLKSICNLRVVVVKDEILESHTKIVKKIGMYAPDMALQHTKIIKNMYAHDMAVDQLELDSSDQAMLSYPKIVVQPPEIVDIREMHAAFETLQFEPDSSNQAMLSYPEVRQLDHLKIPLYAIKRCTQNFNERNFIGKGGYGRVYMGILSWGNYENKPVAVKRLDVTGFQGNKEFYTEVTMLSQYQHANIITLIGFCHDNKEMILVYEYASHGSLDTYLSETTKLGQLTWPQLLEICVGVASALDYLHNHMAPTHRIIHRDIKSSNILLDEKWNAKLSDFGLSRIGLANQQNTFVITNLAGTHGYCDPQYVSTGILTKESDVYSFGVVLFEVLCGRLACVVEYHDERRFLTHLVKTCYENRVVEKIIDHRIKEHIKPITLTKISSIAYQCLQENRKERPTIAEVVFQLKQAKEIQMEASVIGTSSEHSCPL